MKRGRFVSGSIALSLMLAFGHGAHAAPKAAKAPFMWENATIYFVLTDGFNNGDKSNDLAYGRKADAAPLRAARGAGTPPVPWIAEATTERNCFRSTGLVR